MEVLLANVVLLPPGPYRGLLVALRLKFPHDKGSLGTSSYDPPLEGDCYSVPRQ